MNRYEKCPKCGNIICISCGGECSVCGYDWEDPIRESIDGLWCGKIQGRCIGGICADCHMYPVPRRVKIDLL